jgi:TonB family protein
MRISAAAIAASLCLTLAFAAKEAPVIPKGLEYAEPGTTMALVCKVDFLDRYLEEANDRGPGAAQNPASEAIALQMAGAQKRLLPALSGEIVLTVQRPDPTGGAEDGPPSPAVLVVAPVRDRVLLDAGLRELFEATGATLDVAPDGTTFVKTSGKTASELCYRQQDGYLFLGSDPDVIDRAIARERTRDGLHRAPSLLNALADLRKDPEAFGYFREPPVESSSQDAGDEAPATVVAMYRTDHGTVVETFSPGHPIASTSAFGGLSGLFFRGMAPDSSVMMSMQNQKETLNRIAEWGLLIERRRSETKTMPGPTSGFVHLSSVAGQLPSAASLTATDAWGRSLLYRCDGGSYTILSLGKNGAYDSSLLGEARQTTTAFDDRDLVLHDGRFVQGASRERAQDALAGSQPIPREDTAPTVPRPDPSDPAAPRIVAGSVEPPKLSTKVKPVYPEEARLSKIEGKVFLEAIIDETGRVTDVRVRSAVAPDLGLSDAAITAVRQWTYEPAKQEGKPVKVYFTVVVDFRLE